MLNSKTRPLSAAQAIAIAMSAVLAMATSGSAVAQVGRNAEAAPADGDESEKPRYWTTTWNFTDIDIAQLSRRLKAFGIDVGVEVQGKATTRLTVGIPWTAPRDAKAYRFDGTLSSERLVIDELDIQHLQTEIRYRDGVATLSQLEALVADRRDNRRAPGRIAGNGAVELVPRGDVTAELEFDDFVVEPLVDVIAQFAPGQTEAIQRGGRASGNLTFRAPLQRIRDVTTYQLGGQLQWRDVQLSGFPPASVELESVVADRGRLKIGSFNFQTQSGIQTQRRIRLNGKADIPLTGRGEFSFTLEGDDVPLPAVVALATASNIDAATAIIDGKLDLSVTGAGNLADRTEDSTWRIDGSVASPSLRAGGLDMGVLEHRIRFTPSEFELVPFRNAERLPETFQLEAARASYELSTDAIRVNTLRAKLFGGDVTGNLTFPLKDQDDLVVKVTVDNLRPDIRIPIAGRISAPVTATLSAEIDWQVPIRDLMRPRAHQGTATVAAADIRIGDEAVGELSGQLSIDREALSLDADGLLFGGTVDINTTGDLQASERWSDVRRELKAARFEIDGVSVGPLLDLVTGYRLGFSENLGGTLHLVFAPTDGGMTTAANGTVNAELSDIQYESMLLARRVTLTGQVERGVLILQSVVGDYAGGRLRVVGRVDLFDAEGFLHPRPNLLANVSGLQVNRALRFAGEFAENLAGRVSGEARIAGDQRSLAVRGSMTGANLTAYGLQIGTAHSGLIAKLDPSSLRWDARLPKIAARVGRGQLKGELSLTSGYRRGVDLKSRWKAQRVNFFQLSQRLGTPSSLARGNLSGDLSLEGKSVRSLDDLAGRFDFKLSETRGAAIPGLTRASRFLGPFALATQSFDVGEASGLIGQGAVVINEFWLGSDDAIVRADGKIYLASSRMDMIVVIATGDYRRVAADFADLARANVLGAVLPASAVLRVAEILRDRTLVVAVTGTLQNPIVRPRPIETFREEVARLLLREGQRVILGGLAIGTIDGLDDDL